MSDASHASHASPRVAPTKLFQEYNTPIEKLTFEQYPPFDEEEAGEEDFKPDQEQAAEEGEEELELEEETAEAAGATASELELLATEEKEAAQGLGPRKSIRKKQSIERLKPNQAVDSATMKTIKSIARAA